MPYYGMLRRVALVRTGVSEELSLSFIRVTRIGELATLMNERLSSSETSVLTRAIERNIPEDVIFTVILLLFISYGGLVRRLKRTKPFELV
jgi:hypothetical protein